MVEAGEQPRRREPAEETLLPPAVGAVLLGNHVRGRALVDVELPDALGDRRDDLDGAGAGADHRHPLAGDLRVVVPAGGVEDRSLEALGSGDPGQRRAIELPARRDEHVRLDRLSRGGLDSPLGGALVELRLRAFGEWYEVFTV